MSSRSESVMEVFMWEGGDKAWEAESNRNILLTQSIKTNIKKIYVH